MKKLNLLSILLMLFMCAGFAACENDEKGENETTPPGNNDIVETPDDDTSNPGEYFETTAELFLEYFNANDQKAVLTLLDDFIQEYGDYDIEIEENRSSAKPLYAYVKNTHKAINTGNYSRASSSDVWKFADFTGIYEPNDRTWCWERTGNSDALIFKFSHRGASCEFKISVSSDKYTIDIDSYESVEVPKTITTTLTEGNTTHLKSVFKSNYSSTGHTMSANLNLAIANLVFVSNIEGNDSKLSVSQSFTVGDKTLSTASATINGHNLCNRSAIENAIEDDDESALDNFFSDASGESDVLGRVQVKAEVNSLYAIVKAINDRDDAYDDYYYRDRDEEQIEKKYAKAMNEAIKGSFYFARKNQKQGDVLFKAIYEEDTWGDTYWDTYMCLQFNDGSNYTFEDYFGNGNFYSTESLFTNLIDSYKNILGID